ncbi:MAG: DUF1365 domain-containing protein [Rhodospirillales bacterium]|nr:DUF1365 domain-containing protein [Rhodospirillales bacterium]
MSLHSSIYEGVVVHERLRPKRHRLTYKVFSLLLDLDELAALNQNHVLFGYNRPAPLSFFDKDHGSTQDVPLRPWVEARMREASIEPDGGPIRLLCSPRVFGYAFNPISTYFCYQKDGMLAAILYEVCNTYKERHTYVIAASVSGRAVIRQTCKKSLYVSPFIDMEMTYHFRIIAPGERVNIVIREEDEAGLLLAASLAGKRVPLSEIALARCLFRFPLLSLKIMGGIHWEALKLWLKGFPMFTHVAAAAPVESSVGTNKSVRP